MSTLTFDGVRFAAHSDDHLPVHMHEFYAETEVIFELRDNGVWLADRRDPIRPANAKKTDVKKILVVATKYGVELVALWESVYGRV